MAIIIYAGIILFLYITYFYYRYFTRPNPLPGPIPLPFIGTFLQIGIDPRKWAEKNLNESVDIWEFYAGSFRVIVVCDTKYIDKIYFSHNESKSLYKESKFFKRGIAAYDEVGISNGIVFNNIIHKWKRSRQFVTKVLMSKKYHIGFINSVQKIFKELEKQWDENNIVNLDFSKWVFCYKTKITIETVIGQSLYNLPFDSISKAASEHIAMFAFLAFVPNCISNIVMLLGFNTMKKNFIFLNGTTSNIIKKRRNEIKNGSPTAFNLLDLLLIANSLNDSEYIEGERPMDDDEIENNLSDIIAASIETVLLHDF
ncbi:cytochrome P450 [Gigaspora margarita]|uniref:Cytochrome P450 n=1 Tax=Gigaspora margarita TaxID=4874 RepID=A0A8H4EL85_GIGMA|nr:cytochrome P450 [Gigaspora margarita]